MSDNFPSKYLPVESQQWENLEKVWNNSKLVSTKNKNEIVKQIYRIWISFGSPKQFLSDNGGEISNEVFHEMNVKLIQERDQQKENHHLVMILWRATITFCLRFW